MVKKEKAFVVPPRSLFDLISTNDLTQLCISVTGVNPHDTSPGNQLLTQRKKLLPDMESETVEQITADDVRLARDQFGYSALHVAAAFNHPEAVRKLITEYKCDVNATADNGKTPLWVAVENGHLDIAHYLVEQGASVLLVIRESETEVLSLLALAQRKQQHFFVYKLEEALRDIYPTSNKDPVNCAIDGELNYFVLENDRIDGCKMANEVDEAQRYSKLVFAKDSSGNSLLAVVANQFSISAAQLRVAQFLIQKKLFGDVNEGNAAKSTALHCLASACHEKEVGEELQRRMALFDLLVEHGADVRRKNGQGQLLQQCTENQVMKAFIVAEAKRQEYLDMYRQRNQIPYHERPTFVPAIKNVKRAWKQARREAEAALANPPEVVAKTTTGTDNISSSASGVAAAGPSAPASAQPTPRSARGKLTCVLQIHAASNLAKMDALGSSDAYCVVCIGENVVYRTSVVNNSSNPVWDGAVTSLDVEPGTKVTINILDKDITCDESLGKVELALTDDRLDGKPFQLPVQGGEGSLTISFKKS